MSLLATISRRRLLGAAAALPFTPRSLRRPPVSIGNSIDFPDFSGLAQNSSVVELATVLPVPSGGATFGPYHCGGMASAFVKMEAASLAQQMLIDVMVSNPDVGVGSAYSVGVYYTAASGTLNLQDVLALWGGDVYLRFGDPGAGGLDVTTYLVAGQQVGKSLRPAPLTLYYTAGLSVPNGGEVVDLGWCWPGPVQVSYDAGATMMGYSLETAQDASGHYATLGGVLTNLANTQYVQTVQCDGGDIRLVLYNGNVAATNVILSVVGCNLTA